jgi:hypothetical protein
VFDQKENPMPFRAFVVTVALFVFVVGAVTVYQQIMAGYPSTSDATIGWVLTVTGGVVAVVAMLSAGRK